MGFKTTITSKEFVAQYNKDLEGMKLGATSSSADASLPLPKAIVVNRKTNRLSMDRPR